MDLAGVPAWAGEGEGGLSLREQMLAVLASNVRVAEAERGERLAGYGKAQGRGRRQGPASATDLAVLLEGSQTGTGGRFRHTEVDGATVYAEPACRARLDHYGNDGEGWDSEGWRERYAGPLEREVAQVVEAGLGLKLDRDFAVEVGEKGHVCVTLLKP